jgi:hypothetical protein
MLFKKIINSSLMPLVYLVGKQKEPKGYICITDMATTVHSFLYTALLFTSTITQAMPLPGKGGTPLPLYKHLKQPYYTAPGGNEEVVYSEYILKTGENADEKIRKNIFIRVVADKKTCYVGEAVLVTCKLYTRLKSESSFTRNPSFNGFSVIDMQPSHEGNYSIEKIDGREYNVFLLRKAQLYPLQPGVLQLDIAEVENNIRFIKEAYFQNQQEYQFNREQYLNYLTSNFDNASIPAAAISHHKILVSSIPVNITVKDFPAAGKPAAFKGTAGNFSIKASLEKKQLTTDEAGKLLVTISGAGNMMLITAPEIKWPGGMEVFEPKVSETLSKDNVPVSGARYFEFAFTVSQPGTFTIPPVSFSYFDAKAGRYKTDSTQPIKLEVVQGNGSTSSTATIAEGAPEKFFNKIFTNRWWVAGPVIGMILCGLFFWLRNENKKDKLAAIALRQAKQESEGSEPAIIQIPADPLAPAAEQLQKGNYIEFYTTLNSCLKNHLAILLSIHPTDMNKKNLADALDKRGTANSIAVALSGLLDDIEWQLYTPFADAAKMSEFYQRAVEITAALNYS